MAAKEATSTIPIVMTGGGDPVGAGIVESTCPAGRKYHGVSSLSPELITKRLEVLKDVVPKLTLLGVLLTGERGGCRKGATDKRARAAAQSSAM